MLMLFGPTSETTSLKGEVLFGPAKSRTNITALAGSKPAENKTPNMFPELVEGKTNRTPIVLGGENHGFLQISLKPIHDSAGQPHPPCRLATWAREAPDRGIAALRSRRSPASSPALRKRRWTSKSRRLGRSRRAGCRALKSWEDAGNSCG